MSIIRRVWLSCSQFAQYLMSIGYKLKLKCLETSSLNHDMYISSDFSEQTVIKSGYGNLSRKKPQEIIQCKKIQNTTVRLRTNQK